jgi:secreted PhoX family phosphatase
VSHEGIKFDSQGRMYFIDEYFSVSLYRMTPNTAGDLTSGKVEVMKMDDFVGNSAGGGQGQVGRTGEGEWVEIVDAIGNVLTAADPFDFTARGGRAAADEVGATPFGRPEDLEISILANGNEAIFMATTDENIVWSVELGADGNEGVFVSEFVNSLTTLDSSGNPAGTGANDGVYGLDDVDNLAVEFGPNGELQLLLWKMKIPAIYEWLRISMVTVSLTSSTFFLA